MTTHLHLHHLDGRRIAYSFFPDGSQRSCMAAWNWCASTVAEHFDCEPDDVHCDEDTDRVTVAGLPVAHFTIVVDNVHHGA